MPPAVLLMGPTASGKTALALELAARLPLSIISVDSAQIYRDMNIGSAKPDQQTLERFPHRLINILSPEESYSAARFRQDALKAMDEIVADGQVPLLVGGSMLYFRALQEGLADLPQADAALRRSIEEEAAERGWPALHAELERIDPQTARRLAPNDQQRLQRALEVYRLTGQTISCLLAASRPSPPPYRLFSLALIPEDKTVLRARITERFGTMLEAGLVEEVRNLQARYRLHVGLPSMRCVGYRQAWEHLAAPQPSPLEDLRIRGTHATCQLAKRQMTFVRSLAATQLDSLRIDLSTIVYNRIAAFIGS